MKRFVHLTALTAIGLGLLTLAPFERSASAADHTLRVASLAPKNSSWGKVYAVWEKALSKKTEGKLEVQMFFNGVQGGEDAMVSKLKTGQLDGAALTSVGLSYIYKNVLVLQLPGVMTKWAELDEVRTALAPELEAGLKAVGFRVVGWGDIGLVRQFTKGFEIHAPDDYKNRRPATWRNEPMGPAVFSSIGNVVPVVVDPMEVLPNLRSGAINAINAPALAAEQLQWTPYLDHVSDQVSVCAVGGMVFKTGALDGLPADLLKTFDDLQKRASQTQLNRIRKLDQEAYERLLTKMTLVKMTQAERDVWEKLLKKVVKGLAHGTFDKALVNKVLKIRGFELVE
jgi:TRAP-type C4-dicarboxylate transport system substrate-binding protein